MRPFCVFDAPFLPWCMRISKGLFAMGQFFHDQPVCTSIYYSHNCSFIVFSYYGVHFQVADSSAICLLGPFMDTCAVGYLYACFSDRSASMLQVMPTVLHS